MRIIRILVSLFILSHLSLVPYCQIVADHTVVDKYDKIPQQYIDMVKTMLVDMAGESHSMGYIYAVNLLKQLDSRFQVQTYGGSVPAYSNKYLRLGKQYTTGEQQYFTSQDSINKINELYLQDIYIPTLFWLLQLSHLDYLQDVR